ncbi:hypothetical protein HWV62_3544 [Athelia sp. TMB]|nr:hypothetical protein HWV62_3544 [Athelia sp. TMB]
MDALIAVIKSRNEAWQIVINEVPSISGPMRDLIGSISQELWRKFTYEIAILLPDHFLPFEQELFIRDLTTSHISYIRTKVVDKELRIIPTQPDAEPIIYPPFSHSTQRFGSDRVNPFFVCINASSKYEHHRLKYGTETMSPRVDALLQKAATIVELVFAELEPAPNSFGARRRAQQEMEKRERKRRRGENDVKEASREGGRQNRSGGLHDAVESDLSGTIEGTEPEALGSGASEGAMDDQRNGFSLDMDEGGTSDADGGVAFFDAIEEELKQPGLSPRERSRLRLLQLFGGKGYETPHLAGVPDLPSVFDRISKGDYNAYERAR